MSELTLNHKATPEMESEVARFRDAEGLTGEVELLEAADRVRAAQEGLAQIADTVGEESLDEAVADYVDGATHSGDITVAEEERAVAVGLEEVLEHPHDSSHTAKELGETQIGVLEGALNDIAEVRGDDAIEDVVQAIEAAEEAQTGTGIPQFDQLDDYTPEFSGQILMHRSNAELNEGDIVLPSDQISPELYEELNGERSFSSGSDPRKGEYAAGTDGYDRKLVHAGTRDYGDAYGKYLYVVEPLEGDTLKWGENFGVDISRKQRVKSPAFGGIGTSRMQPATTDSHTGKWHNEVVSTRGFRVVKRIPHEPEYSEGLLPWPVGPDAVARREVRSGNKDSNVALSRRDTEPGYGSLTFPVRTTSRKRPGKIGAMDSKGTYRAGADEQIPANLRTRFDVRKQYIENGGQSAFPGMSMSKYGDPDRWKPIDVPRPSSEYEEPDTPLPGMEDIKPSIPQM